MSQNKVRENIVRNVTVDPSDNGTLNLQLEPGYNEREVRIMVGGSATLETCVSIEDLRTALELIEVME